MPSYQHLHPDLRPYFEYLVQVARDANLNPRVTSTYRSTADQTRLYKAYVAGKSKFPAAPPGRSLHEQGRAIDIVCDDLEWLGRVWESWGGRWGGRFRDPIHFEA